ncbi:SOS response-associated peptidase family protein [Stenotrophomonas sp. HITSZ_GD]|uniref:SOS response-associated peptidase n=1 Tax=Stenotrophomonas sp. HITSZ_GD TaxID=3037248 RepID=UPI00240D081C|nr:SOS response-associated peptidase family protein [Stenotrophomonas sp. HITSZ_GD]MDG2524904.1 SOS response-associated peptidase family protein [Stenotrophomonas sp. HITSZ_GD]
MRRFAQAIAEEDSLPAGFPPALARALAAAPDRYNIGKGKQAVVIRQVAGELVLAEMTWGLVPRWSKQPHTPYTTVTARLSKAPRSRIYAKAWQERHCLVPMSGYYKWDRQRQPPWPRFVQRSDGLALFAAGLWEHWASEDAALDSFALLTAPNPDIPPPLTPDGPVFLEPPHALAWLEGGLTEPGALPRHAASVRLESYPVSRAIRDPARDTFTLLEPVDPDAPGEAEWAQGEDEPDEDDLD